MTERQKELINTLSAWQTWIGYAQGVLATYESCGADSAIENLCEMGGQMESLITELIEREGRQNHSRHEDDLK